MAKGTIAAIATASGRGGVGIVRISGPQALDIGRTICGELPAPRQAVLTDFLDHTGQPIDQGLVVAFVAPQSFTGEDVVELQGHGGPVVMDCLLQRVLALGARMAGPGEFSQRAFLNDKMDLAQAEAVADLIDASSTAAARSAMRSLQGEFSAQITPLVEQLIDLRVLVEGAIDFPEEEIDFISEGRVAERIEALLVAVQQILATAEQGVLLREGVDVAFAGPPNVGKSSLLNCLTGEETAIVSDVAGTTRDVIRQSINLEGLPLHLVDTAGLRESDDQIEVEGIRRARAAVAKAALVILVLDAGQHQLADLPGLIETFFGDQVAAEQLLVVFNKADLLDATAQAKFDALLVSAKSGQGRAALTVEIQSRVGYHAQTEGVFIARQRHLQALDAAKVALGRARVQLSGQRAAELVAEDLYRAQRSLGEITGQFTQDDLLGEIFSRFCIGK